MKGGALWMNDEKIILALLSNPTVTDAAKELGVTPQTIYNRLRDDSFRSLYAERRQQVLSENCYRLQGYVGDAIETLHDVVVDEMGTATQVRLNAADALLRHCYRLTELTDILQRLEKLESQMKGE
jgi:hypothetical protein